MMHQKLKIERERLLNIKNEEFACSFDKFLEYMDESDL